ncbi:MAG: alpha-keto acid decarboxylase family protein [Cyanobacteria bacterium K_Offshore_surface_m2_011]|nr:alpha-keto acid decarboxylase family protein [Cyanobacteria bacterium K_Offshore_surface_m2_011]
MPGPSLVQYTLDRLADLGIGHVFGVPGDYAFPVNDAVEIHPRLQWVASANELNAAYAADGYARRRGAAILSTTYGVGELSALNGVMGANAERLPVFHIVGAPSLRIVKQGLICHHSLGDGQHERFEPISAAACCVSARLTPENAVIELERVIDRALEQSRPAYLVLPMDLALMPISDAPLHGSPLGSLPQRLSVGGELEAALSLVAERIRQASRAVVLPTVLLRRYGLVPALERFLAASGLPYATTPMDKALLPEDHPAFLGLYNGGRSAPAALQELVEQADLLVDVGGLVQEDLNTGLWSDHLDPRRIVSLREDWVQVGGAGGPNVFTSVGLGDMLEGLAARLQPPPGGSRWGADRPLQPPQPLPLAGEPQDTLSSDLFYPRLQRFLSANDLLVVDTGSCLLRTNPLRLPAGVAMESQTLWGSIGWGTPAALGCALAEPQRRVVLLTGDGAHQLTAQELGVMGACGIAPVVIVLNNGLYGIEAVISETGHAYNVIPSWQYSRLPEVLGCQGWWSGRVTRLAELEQALAAIQRHPGGALLEVVLPAEESQPLPEPVIERLHQTHTP